MLYTMKNTRRSISRLLLLCAACTVTCIALAQSLEVIELKYRSAAEVIPVLQPLLEPGGALTGQDYKLFVRASGANIAQLRKALAQLDRQPRQFLVSVRRATQQQMRQEQAAASARVGSNGASISLSTGEAASGRNSDGVQSVKVLEGSAAYIAAGASVPVITSVLAGGGQRSAERSRVGVATSYRDLSSGFTVTPRLAGEQITLDISQQAQRRADGGGVQTQSLSTQVTGRLGEWLRLGGVEESATTQSSGAAGGRYATSSDEQSIWVRVVGDP